MSYSSLAPLVVSLKPGRFLLLPEDKGSQTDAERPRIRRYRLTRMGARSKLPSLNPNERPADDFTHLRRTYD
jgi:hypothetical protein